MDGAPELRRVLRETLAWCVPRFSMFDLAGSLRQLPRPVLDEAATQLQGAVRAIREHRRELVRFEAAGFRGSQPDEF